MKVRTAFPRSGSDPPIEASRVGSGTGRDQDLTSHSWV